MHLNGFEPTISEGERSQTCALDRAAIGTGKNAYSNEELILPEVVCYILYLTYY
jgi:hypothetical protein